MRSRLPNKDELQGLRQRHGNCELGKAARETGNLNTVLLSTWPWLICLPLQNNGLGEIIRQAFRRFL